MTCRIEAKDTMADKKNFMAELGVLVIAPSQTPPSFYMAYDALNIHSFVTTDIGRRLRLLVLPCL